LNRALKLKPTSPETLYLLALVYKNESRPLDALNLLISARKLSPEQADIWKGEMLLFQGAYKEALPLFSNNALYAAAWRGALATCASC